MSFSLRSDNFAPGEEIPELHTCDGVDFSPHLSWSGAPEGTRSFALIVDDPDAPDPRAPKVTWVHWVLYNLPADASQLPRSVAPESLPHGTRHGLNDWQRTGYGGPCPPIGRHRYFFKLYALDSVLPDLGAATKDEVLAAMEGKVLAMAELVGTYARRR